MNTSIFKLNLLFSNLCIWTDLFRLEPKIPEFCLQYKLAKVQISFPFEMPLIGKWFDFYYPNNWFQKWIRIVLLKQAQKTNKPVLSNSIHVLKIEYTN